MATLKVDNRIFAYSRMRSFMDLPSPSQFIVRNSNSEQIPSPGTSLPPGAPHRALATARCHPLPISGPVEKSIVLVSCLKDKAPPWRCVYLAAYVVAIAVTFNNAKSPDSLCLQDEDADAKEKRCDAEVEKALREASEKASETKASAAATKQAADEAVEAAAGAQREAVEAEAAARRRPKNRVFRKDEDSAWKHYTNEPFHFWESLYIFFKSRMSPNDVIQVFISVIGQLVCATIPGFDVGYNGDFVQVCNVLRSRTFFGSNRDVRFLIEQSLLPARHRVAHAPAADPDGCDDFAEAWKVGKAGEHLFVLLYKETSSDVYEAAAEDIRRLYRHLELGIRKQVVEDKEDCTQRKLDKELLERQARVKTEALEHARQHSLSEKGKADAAAAVAAEELKLAETAMAKVTERERAKAAERARAEAAAAASRALAEAAALRRSGGSSFDSHSFLYVLLSLQS